MRGAFAGGVHTLFLDRKSNHFTDSDYLALSNLFLEISRQEKLSITTELAALSLLEVSGTKPKVDSELTKARPLGEKVGPVIVQAEDGKVVGETIESTPYVTPAGTMGSLALMGRDATFWMRFDVPAEDEYLFELQYLQSPLGGGLVSVLMRIDGDKDIQGPLRWRGRGNFIDQATSR